MYMHTYQVRIEIAQRLKRNFPTLANVTWE